MTFSIMEQEKGDFLIRGWMDASQINCIDSLSSWSIQLFCLIDHLLFNTSQLVMCDVVIPT